MGLFGLRGIFQLFVFWVIVVPDFKHRLEVRSFTVYDPNKSGGCQIGVVLYQKGFFVAKANYDITMEIIGKAPYPTGGIQIGWDDDVQCAWCQRVFEYLVYMQNRFEPKLNRNKS